MIRLSYRPDDFFLNECVGQTNVLSVQLLSSIIDGVISEKRLQYRSKIGIEIDAVLDERSYGAFAEINTVEFKRVLSNLINNAVEVLDRVGKVTVEVNPGHDQVRISVVDDGRGIPPEILERLCEKGQTYGKPEGSGLGLFHARKAVESWGGRLEIHSQLGHGTVVCMVLPNATPPSWFVSKLSLSPGSKVIVVDDDTSIHHIWDRRFESLSDPEYRFDVLHFSSTTQVKSWLAETGQSSRYCTFLVDYELLGSKETGLDLIESCGLQEQSVLVTSRFEETFVRERCDRLKVKLIPKGMAGFVPMEVISMPSAKNGIEAVLIDDDVLVRSTWQISARESKKNIAVLGAPEEFWRLSHEVDKNIPIYIDVNLKNGVRGDEFAKRLFDVGFCNLYLCTGYRAGDFGQMAHVKGVIGKDWPY